MTDEPVKIPPLFKGRSGGVSGGLLLTAIFLLPWQTRWIFSMPLLHGGAWEYGIGSLYAVEVLIFLAAIFSDWKKNIATIKPLALPIVAMIFALGISATFGSDPSVSWFALIHIFFAGLFALLLTTTDLPLKKTIGAFVCGLIPPSILGWFQVLTNTSPSTKWLGLASHLASTPGVAVVEDAAGRLLRAYGSFSHPNIFGGYLAIGILMLIWIGHKTSSCQAGGDAEARGGRSRGWLYAAVAAFLGATLVITFSRSAVIALLLGLIILIIFRRHLFKKNVAFIGLVLGVLISALWFHTPLLSRTSESNRLETISITQRESQYGEFFDVFKTSPIIGVGTSAYTKSLGDIFPDRAAYDLQPIHNVFLLFLAEQGIIGILALLFFVWMLWKYFIKSEAGDKPPRYVLRATYYVLVFFPIALVDHYLWSSWSGLALMAATFTIAFKAYETSR